MKKKLVLLFLTCVLITNNVYAKVISNEKIDEKKVEIAQKIITDLQKEMKSCTDNGAGPFVAAIYDDKGNLVAKTANSVVKDNCSSCHAEMNVIREAEKKLGTYDLSKYNLSLYVTAEPCMMCLGGIMWSGIKYVYFGVPSKSVEEITGFDEGFKPNWFKEFKRRGIVVYGNIEPKIGGKALYKYVKDGEKIYMPQR